MKSKRKNTILQLLFLIVLFVGMFAITVEAMNYYKVDFSNPGDSYFDSKIVAESQNLEHDDEVENYQPTVVQKTLSLFTNQKRIILISDYVSMSDDLSFIVYSGDSMTINPTKVDIGSHQIELMNQFGDKIIYEINIVLPEVSFDKLEDYVIDAIGSELDNYRLTLYDLNRERGFSINGEVVTQPASISKVPFAVMVLQDIESGKMSFKQLLNGINIEEHLSRMIRDSNNDSLLAFNTNYGYYHKVNPRIQNELGIETLNFYPHDAKTDDTALLFRNIYNGDYLSEVYNNYLINLLSTTAPQWQDRIAAGVPDGVQVAHKIGQLYDGENYFVWNDAGIVYGQSTDFVLVIMTKHVDKVETSKKISTITQLIYNELN